MAKSIKLKNNNYIDSSGITHNRELLSTILNIKKYTINNYLVNSWSTNGLNVLANFNGLKVLSISVRHGTDTTIINSLPSDMRPSGTVLVTTYNGSTGTYGIIDTNGKVYILDSNQVGENVIFTTVYY